MPYEYSLGSCNALMGVNEVGVQAIYAAQCLQLKLLNKTVQDILQCGSC